MEISNTVTKTITEKETKMTVTILWNDEADKFLSSYDSKIKISFATPIMVIDVQKINQKLKRIVLIGEYGNCLKKQVRKYYRNKKREACDLAAYNLALDVIIK